MQPGLRQTGTIRSAQPIEVLLAKTATPHKPPDLTAGNAPGDHCTGTLVQSPAGCTRVGTGG